jgi:hypothetical protein
VAIFQAVLWEIGDNLEKEHVVVVMGRGRESRVVVVEADSM